LGHDEEGRGKIRTVVNGGGSQVDLIRGYLWDVIVRGVVEGVEMTIRGLHRPEHPLFY
jgi:hypothetical protein